MSKLQDDEVLHCSNCNTKMKEILLCKNRIHIYTNNIIECTTRCVSMTCSDCEYCDYCNKRIQELKNRLKKYRHGRLDEETEACKCIINELKRNHDIDI